MKKKLREKHAAVDALLNHYNNTISELSAKIRRRSLELNGLMKLQRADRYVMHELMTRRREYIRAALEAAERGE